MGSSNAWRVWRVAGLVVLLVAASAIGPLAWGQLREAFGQSVGGAKPVVVPITPFRLVDTRPASEDPALGGPDEPFGQGETRTYQVAGVQPVPAGAVGVVLNITALSASTPSFLTLFPAGSGIPSTSTLNPAPGLTVFNSATVLLGGGKFSVFHNAGSVHVIIDVVGYLLDHNHDERYLEQSQPIVITQGAGEFQRLGSTPTVFTPIGHLLATSGDGALIMPLESANSVGGTQYRLASVEWCLLQNATNNAFVTSAVVFHDQPGAPSSPVAIAVQDLTDRSTAGCFTLNVPALTPRGYSLGLGLTASPAPVTTTSLTFQSVRTTWVPVSGSADEVAAPSVDGPSLATPEDITAFLLQG